MKGQKVDLIIHNAKIHTMDLSSSVQDAIAIRNGKIVEVGPERQILNKYRSSTDLTDEEIYRKIEKEMDIADLLVSLKSGIVEIEFKSLNSGNTKQVICTLHESYLENHISMNQDATNETILVYKIESKEWEDIRVDSIVSYDLPGDK